jgi:hypothetical protein
MQQAGRTISQENNPQQSNNFPNAILLLFYMVCKKLPEAKPPIKVEITPSMTCIRLSFNQVKIYISACFKNSNRIFSNPPKSNDSK